MEDRTGVDQNGSCRHLGLRNFVWLNFPIVGPLGASRYDLGRPIFRGEVRYRPDCVELGFEMAQMPAPGPAIAVDGLGLFTWPNANDLGQVQLDAFAIRRQKLFTGFKDCWVFNQFSTALRANKKAAGTGGIEPGKRVLPVAGVVHEGVGLATQGRQKLRSKRRLKLPRHRAQRLR